MITPQNSSPPPLRSSDGYSSGDPDRHGAGLFDYVLGLGDDALISAQRAGGSAAPPARGGRRAGQHRPRPARPAARTLLAYAGEVEGDGRSEDDLAYLRDERDFRNVKLVERDQTDFGVAMARLLVFATWQAELYAALAEHADAPSRELPARPSRRSPTTSTTPTSGCSASATAQTSRSAACRRPSTPSWPYVDELFDAAPVDAGLVADGIADVPGHAPRAGAGADHGGRRARHPVRARGRPRRRRWPARAAHRGDGLPARRDAAPHLLPPGVTW